MEERMMSDKIDQLVPALIEVQKTVLPVKFDADNPFFGSQYASLGAVWDAYRLPLTEHGLAVSQVGAPAPEGHVGITTLLLHKSGQWLGGTFILPLKVDKKKGSGEEIDPHDPQKAGSAITYARRYALNALVMGVSEEDDDANNASGKDKGAVKGNPPAGQKSATPQASPDKPASEKQIGLLKKIFDRISGADKLKLVQGVLQDEKATLHNLNSAQASKLIEYGLDPANKKAIDEMRVE